jgi:hypothetical protein
MAKGIALDKTITPLKPTLTLTSTFGSATVVTKLYGTVTPEREAKERREVAYRAQQIAPVERRKRPELDLNDWYDKVPTRRREF